MAYQIKLPGTVVEQLAALPKKVQRQIGRRIDALAHDPRPPAAKALQSRHQGLLKLRSGDHRIVYQVKDQERIVLIVKVGHRRDIYRRL